MRPKASRAGFVCRTDQYFQRQRLTCTCRLKTVKSTRQVTEENGMSLSMMQLILVKENNKFLPELTFVCSHWRTVGQSTHPQLWAQRTLQGAPPPNKQNCWQLYRQKNFLDSLWHLPQILSLSSFNLLLCPDHRRSEGHYKIRFSFCLSCAST